jgi:hypothetical protein
MTLQFIVNQNHGMAQIYSLANSQLEVLYNLYNLRINHYFIFLVYFFTQRDKNKWKTATYCCVVQVNAGAKLRYIACFLQCSTMSQNGCWVLPPHIKKIYWALSQGSKISMTKSWKASSDSDSLKLFPDVLRLSYCLLHTVRYHRSLCTLRNVGQSCFLFFTNIELIQYICVSHI